MRAGRAIRENARDDAAWRTLCENGCGHSVMVHREVSPTLLALVDGSLVEEPNPAYRPCQFHCAECDCVVSR